MSGQISGRMTAEKADTLVFLMEGEFPGHQESLALRDYLGVSILFQFLLARLLIYLTTSGLAPGV